MVPLNVSDPQQHGGELGLRALRDHRISTEPKIILNSQMRGHRINWPWNISDTGPNVFWAGAFN